MAIGKSGSLTKSFHAAALGMVEFCLIRDLYIKPSVFQNFLTKPTFSIQGPASNPEANCGYFKWAAASKCKEKGK